jgi:hypothetical protein
MFSSFPSLTSLELILRQDLEARLLVLAPKLHQFLHLEVITVGHKFSEKMTDFLEALAIYAPRLREIRISLDLDNALQVLPKFKLLSLARIYLMNPTPQQKAPLATLMARISSLMVDFTPLLTISQLALDLAFEGSSLDFLQFSIPVPTHTFLLNLTSLSSLILSKLNDSESEDYRFLSLPCLTHLDIENFGVSQTSSLRKLFRAVLNHPNLTDFTIRPFFALSAASTERDYLIETEFSLSLLELLASPRLTYLNVQNAHFVSHPNILYQ